MSRAARFVWVGAGGFLVQVAALQALGAAGLPYPVATALAVEAAILHNFLWHERWTWGDRNAVAGTGLKARRSEKLGRLVRFNGSTALISIGGNVALMTLFVGGLHLPLIPANLLAVLTLGVLNFVSADRLVFTTKLTHRQSDPTPM
jgi:putative flippase GtrA